jgi:hypothetical protein
LDHSKRLIVLVIVTAAIVGYLALDAWLSPPPAPTGPAAPAVAPAGQ